LSIALSNGKGEVMQTKWPVIGWLLVLCCLLTACKGTSESKEPFSPSWTSRFYGEESEDGWYHIFYIETMKNDEYTYYFYNAYNLKYAQIPGYVHRGYSGGEVVETMMPAVPGLHVSPNAARYEFIDIADFFAQKKPTSEISVSYLDELDLKYISKEEIVRLFNCAINSDPEPEGSYWELPTSIICPEKNGTDGYRWQLSYYINYGNIQTVQIHLIYDDETYLSDQRDRDPVLYEMIEQIEKKMIRTQKFDFHISDYPEKYAGDLQRLKDLIAEATS